MSTKKLQNNSPARELTRRKRLLVECGAMSGLPHTWVFTKWPISLRKHWCSTEIRGTSVAPCGLVMTSTHSMDETVETPADRYHLRSTLHHLLQEVEIAVAPRFLRISSSQNFANGLGWVIVAYPCLSMPTFPNW